jgi:hypothetical protein
VKVVCQAFFENFFGFFLKSLEMAILREMNRAKKFGRGFGSCIHIIFAASIV